jgi:hypothetical protein
MIPCDQESVDALDKARKALDDHGRFWFGNETKVEAEFYVLDLLTPEERYIAVDMALTEVTCKDREGPDSPNDRSAHGPFKGLKLFAFRWKSLEHGKIMYIKFGLPCDPLPVKLALYSFHEAKY